MCTIICLFAFGLLLLFPEGMTYRTQIMFHCAVVQWHPCKETKTRHDTLIPEVNVAFIDLERLVVQAVKH